MRTLSLWLLGLSLVPTLALGQNYKLDRNSDLIGSCGFIHSDKYSFNDVLTLIQEQLKSKLDADQACAAPLAQLNAQLIHLDNYFNRQISEKEKKELSRNASTEYLVDLEAELMLLNPADPSNAPRIASLNAIIDSVKGRLVTIGVESQIAAMEDKERDQQIILQKWENVYATSTSALTTLNSLPPQCVDRLGGWKNMLPVAMKLASASGPLVGGVVGGVISAGFEAGSQVALLLRNNKVKRAISDTNRVQNAQILACTYSVLQTNACELRRAKKLMDDKVKIRELINQRITNTKEAEYEAYFLQMSRLPRIQAIMKDIGAMGSALTLDLELLGRYFAAVRLDPESITDIPNSEASDGELTDFFIRMKARGLDWNEFSPQGPVSLRDQLTQVLNLIRAAKSVIKAAEDLMTKKQSYFILKSEVLSNNQFVVKELLGLKNYFHLYMDPTILPSQYRADFATNTIMMERLIDFLGYDYLGNTDEEYNAYLVEVDKRGRKVFEEMARGSVAQITTQTVLMIPDVAFRRFNRPFRQLEKYFITNDIINKDDPTHKPFTDFVINRSMQSNFATYPDFHGTKEAFRVDTYLAARNGLEKGFRREMISMVKEAMESRSDILKDFEGKTAAHLCALYAGFLKEEAPKLFQKCQENYKTLSLLPILSEANRPSSMKIDYNDPCFYNSYKQEEEGQRRLFEKLIDYGNRNNLIFSK